jgi:hypothetical protein
MAKKSNEIWANFKHFLGNRKNQDKFMNKAVVFLIKITIIKLFILVRLHFDQII